MNNILVLKGNKFQQKNRFLSGGGISITAKNTISLEKLKEIHNSLIKVNDFWINNNVIDGALVSVYYNQIVAKSNRIGGYLKKSSSFIPNDSIVGAKFNKEKEKHIITHYISKETLNKTIEFSQNIINLFEETFGNFTMNSVFFNNQENFLNLNYDKYKLSKTDFRQFLKDSSFIDEFGIEKSTTDDYESSLVTFYDLKINPIKLLKNVGIDILESDVLNPTTVLLDQQKFKSIMSKAPYLISMAVEDFSKISQYDLQSEVREMKNTIHSPTNEPIIGVIDSLFSEDVYFNEWVEYHDLVTNDLRKTPEDYQHGTRVSSLIVDAPNLNKKLDDGCGNFRVRHFGVSLKGGYNSFAIIKLIREIVDQNRDIKVWNLSLGSSEEIKDNFISIEASLLDEIQFEYDVIFIIAGTNLSNNETNKKIGSPADSLNSLVVSSVDFNNKPVYYSRKGVVLSFFIKPDISYYGGDKKNPIYVCDSFGLQQVVGTSFAAPLISRKMAYLIHIMGLSREEAKALIVDSAIGWKKQPYEVSLIGNGVVPIRIEDIIQTPEDEIKFIVSDISEKYDTFNYSFPVPIYKEKFPYVAKATMAYFPKMSRNQGVDYTNTELNIVFGRLDTKKEITPINNDYQNSDKLPGYVKERAARDLYRKWDNVKHIGENFSEKKQAKKILNENNPQWGMSIKTIERLKSSDGFKVRFGVVVTLKEINGVNRIEEFIQKAMLRGWIVKPLEINNQIKIYNKLNEEITFE